MGYYTREDIPFQFALAEAFTICDNYHCSVLGPTWPNRLMWMTGTIDPDGAPAAPSSATGAEGAYRWTTYAERLRRRRELEVYQQDDDYGCNMLEYFAQFQDAGPGDALYDTGMTSAARGQFEQDALNDQLPTVSWIIPTGGHVRAPDYLPAAGADFVARSSTRSPPTRRCGRKTVFILNYDENDGLFDHVVPPTPPAGTPDEFVTDVPGDAGPAGRRRLPGAVHHRLAVDRGRPGAQRVFDHTSVLRFLEKLTGVKETNITPGAETFGDLTSAFRFRSATPGIPPRLPGRGAAEQVEKAKEEVATLPKPTLPGGGPERSRARNTGGGPHGAWPGLRGPAPLAAPAPAPRGESATSRCSL